MTATSATTPSSWTGTISYTPRVSPTQSTTISPRIKRPSTPRTGAASAPSQSTPPGSTSRLLKWGSPPTSTSTSTPRSSSAGSSARAPSGHTPRSTSREGATCWPRWGPTLTSCSPSGSGSRRGSCSSPRPSARKSTGSPSASSTKTG